jgi:hypothetical protein
MGIGEVIDNGDGSVTLNLSINGVADDLPEGNVQRIDAILVQEDLGDIHLTVNGNELDVFAVCVDEGCAYPVNSDTQNISGIPFVISDVSIDLSSLIEGPELNKDEIVLRSVLIGEYDSNGNFVREYYLPVTNKTPLSIDAVTVADGKANIKMSSSGSLYILNILMPDLVKHDLGKVDIVFNTDDDPSRPEVVTTAANRHYDGYVSYKSFSETKGIEGIFVSPGQQVDVQMAPGSRNDMEFLDENIKITALLVKNLNGKEFFIKVRD